MKKPPCLVLIALVALGFTACKKKEEAAVPEKPTLIEQAVEKAVEVLKPAPQVVVRTADERAAKLGFAKYLSDDTDYLISFYNGSKTADRVKATKLWKLVQKQMTGNTGMDTLDDEMAADAQDAEMPDELDDAAAAAEADVDVDPDQPAPDEALPDDEMGPAMLFGSEFTMAWGKPSGEQLGHLLKLNARMSYFQMRGLVKTLVAASQEADSESLAEAMAAGYTTELFTEMLKDPEGGIGLIESLKMPPLTFAFRVDPARLESAAQQVAAMLANGNMLGEMVEPIEAEKGGAKFQGLKISGEKVSQTLAASRETLDAQLEPATVDRLIAAVAKNDIVAASGTVGEYVVLFIGSSLDELTLAENPGKSLLAGSKLAFSDAYHSKEIAALIYVDKAAMDTAYVSAGGLAEVVTGLRDGVANSEGLGDTRDLETMFQVVADREGALKKLASSEAQGMIAFFEEGLKIESYGGMDRGASDWKKPNKLAHLGSSSEVALFANMNVTAEYDEKSREYFEALFETAYGMAMKAAELPFKDEQFTQYAEMAKMIDGQFRGDAISLWQAFSGDFGQGLGHESALIVDLKGSAPAIPGIPQNVVDQAKIPRISLIAPVNDRAKLAASWEKMNTTTTKILSQVSEMTGTQIPMQKPLSSEKDGFTTWFFPLPFFNDDFLPSVTVGEEWFVASTSRNQALDLITQAKAGGEPSDGFTMKLNFKMLEAYAKETAKMVEENAEAMNGEALTPEQIELVNEAISTISELDQMTVHARREGATLRSTVHFKTRAAAP